MQKYLFYGSYTPEGYKGLLAEGGSVRIDIASFHLPLFIPIIPRNGI